MEIFDQDTGLPVLLRALHVLAGIAWIGLLYYFNVVQVPAFAAYGDEARARNVSIAQLANRALWWFRWAAIATLVLGLLITGATEDYFQDFMTGDSYSVAHNSAILVGMLFGITMAANVWMVIWKNQKIVIANAANLVAGGEADPAAVGAAIPPARRGCSCCSPSSSGAPSSSSPWATSAARRPPTSCCGRSNRTRTR